MNIRIAGVELALAKKHDESPSEIWHSGVSDLLSLLAEASSITANPAFAHSTTLLSENKPDSPRPPEISRDDDEYWAQFYYRLPLGRHTCAREINGMNGIMVILLRGMAHARNSTNSTSEGPRYTRDS